MLRVGEHVRSGIGLPGIPAGAVGVVKEVGRLFVAVQFDDGRMGYYARRQLTRVGQATRGMAEGASATTDLGWGDSVVPAGSHLCLLPRSRRDALHSVARYVVAGLKAKEQCLCAVPTEWGERLPAEAARLVGASPNDWGADRLVVANALDVYPEGERFVARDQIALLKRVLSGCTGRPTRIVGYPAQAFQGMPAAEWWEYELAVTPLLREAGVSALCVYTPAFARSSDARHACAAHPYVFRDGMLRLGGSSLLA